MSFFVAVTDYDWFKLHAPKPLIEEVNFWRPSPEASFKALNVGEMLLFKLHSPLNSIVARRGFFARIDPKRTPCEGLNLLMKELTLFLSSHSEISLVGGDAC
jgi:hypothetical protein